MKKTGMALAVLLCLSAFLSPFSWAIMDESGAGGYWRSRMYNGGNDAQDDTFHQQLKFNVVPYSPLLWNEGQDLQEIRIQQAFLFDTKATVLTDKEDLHIPFIWLKSLSERRKSSIFRLSVELGTADFRFKPFFNYFAFERGLAHDDFSHEYALSWTGSNHNAEEMNLYFAGLNMSADVGDKLSLWLTGFYQEGSAELRGGSTAELSAWLAAAGGKLDLSFGNIHSQIFYASDSTRNDQDNLNVSASRFYEWAEIMGPGLFMALDENAYSLDSSGDMLAGNLGLTLKPAEKLALTLDVWHAELLKRMSKEDEDKEKKDYLGTELDLKITYELSEGLTVDVVGAYLFSGEATKDKNPDKADPYEIGTRLSLSF